MKKEWLQCINPAKSGLLGNIRQCGSVLPPWKSCLLTISFTGSQAVGWFKGIALARRRDRSNAASEATPLVDATFRDGDVVVQMLNPGTAMFFLDYAEQVFLPNVSAKLENTPRVDIVWDVYQTVSLKCTTRQKRGTLVPIRVVPYAVIQQIWKDLLHVD